MRSSIVTVAPREACLQNYYKMKKNLYLKTNLSNLIALEAHRFSARQKVFDVFFGRLAKVNVATLVDNGAVLLPNYKKPFNGDPSI